MKINDNHPALSDNWHASVLGNMAIFFKDFQNHCRTPVHPPQGLSIYSVCISQVKSWTFAHGTSTIHQLVTCLKSSGKSREFLSTSTSIFRSWSVSRWWLSMTIVCVSETSVAWRCSFVWQIPLVLMFQYWHPNQVPNQWIFWVCWVPNQSESAVLETYTESSP